MDQAWKQMIETNISEYITQIDFKHPDFSINEFKINLSKLIGITPAVKLKWDKIEKINELLKKSGATDYKEIIEKVQQIDITIVDENNTPIVFKYMV